MRKSLCTVVCLAVIFVATLSGASFPRISTKSAEGESFVFPDDAIAEGPVLFALAISDSRENGEEQQRQLIAWQAYLDEHPSLLQGIPVYHIPVIGKVPFFVKGAIRNGMGKAYGKSAPPDRVAVLFVRDLEKFIGQSGIVVDENPTLALVRQDGDIVGFVKGGVTEGNLSALVALVSAL